MNYYKKIPKELRKKYKKVIRKTFWKGVKAFFIFPLVYRKRKELYELGRVENNTHLKASHLYWYADNAEPDFISCWWGNETYRKRKGFDYDKASAFHKYFAALRWTVFRNSVWNYKTLIGLPLLGGYDIEEIIHVEGEAGPMNWRDIHDLGIQCVILRSKVNGELFFRYSHMLPNKNPLAKLLGYTWKNKMRGVENRYIYKNRWFK